MAAQTLEVHSSKLCYATLKKMTTLLNNYNTNKDLLEPYFPGITVDAQWLAIRTTCYYYLQSNTNWIGASAGSPSSSSSNTLTYNMINLSSMTVLRNSLVNDGVDMSGTIDWDSMST